MIYRIITIYDNGSRSVSDMFFRSEINAIRAALNVSNQAGYKVYTQGFKRGVPQGSPKAV